MPAWSPRRASPPFRSPQPPWPPCRLGASTSAPRPTSAASRAALAVNIVPAVVTLMGECRSLYEDRVLAQRDAMTRALEEAAARFGGQVEVAWELDYPAVMHEPGDAIVAHLEAAAATCGLESRHATSGGGADANILGTKGADAITLGIGMTNFHSVDEYIEVADLQNMARYVEAIIAEYAG
ncbi:M20/M25/M40 family metallo-hydrolase [Adlercreutzia sp.]|uniref:M20/M25/M40 family metallo-hydrolase n=1 Tax=Adlercreutzia sp. TaxID=1872387 RepID=UPI003AB15945